MSRLKRNVNRVEAGAALPMLKLSARKLPFALRRSVQNPKTHVTE